jgi:serine protease Do
MVNLTQGRGRRRLVVVAYLIGAAGVVLMAAPPGQRSPSKTPADRQAGPVLRRGDVARVAREQQNAVVSLHTLRGGLRSDATQRLWVEPLEEGLGSGVVIDADGLVLTNAHVIERAGVIHVRTPEGDDIEAEVVGRDPEDDLALVRAKGITARAAILGDSNRLAVGDWVVAVGAPLGLHHTVTVGIISAKARGIDESGLEFLQTDAAINPGSSGGPLFDLDGKVVGIATVIVSSAGGNVGLNFAIPINTVKAVLPQLRAGRVVHGWLGVVTLAMNANGARRFGLRSPSDGLYVSEIAPGGPADDAGLRVGDVLLGMTAGSEVSARDLHTMLRQLAPGTHVVLRVLRDGQQVERQATVGVGPSSEGLRR